MKSKSSFSVNQTGLTALFALMLAFSVFISPVSADERAKADQKRAQEILDVVSEQVDRHMYDAALATISSIDSSDEIILNEKQARQLEEYREESSSGVDAQSEAVKALEGIEKLVADENYSDAAAELEVIKSGKEYLTDDIINGLKQAETSVDVLGQTLKARAKKQFAQSKQYYKQGDLNEARIGFEAVAASGVELSFFDRGGDFGTADTYLAKITQREAAEISGEAVEELDTEPIAEEVAVAEAEPAVVSADEELVTAAKPKAKKSGFWPFGGGSKGKKLNAEEVAQVERLIAFGDLSMTKKKYEQAKQYFLQALEINPDSEKAQKFLTVAEYHINRPVNQAEAAKLSIIDKVKQRQSLQVQAVKSNWVNTREHTSTLVAEGKYSAALTEIVQALASIESNRQVLGDETYAALKVEAEDLRRQVELYKSEAEAKSREDKIRRAAELQKQIADKVEQERQSNIDNLFAIANQFAEKRRFQNAIDTIDRLLTIDPNNETAKYLRNSYEQFLLWQKQHEAARETDRNVVNLLIDADQSMTPPPDRINYPTPEEWRRKDKRKPKDVGVASSKKDTLERTKSVRIEIEFDDIPLMEALDSIANDGGVVVLAMWPELDLAGITPDDLVTVRGAKMSIGKALDFVLDYVSAGTMGKAGFEVDEEGNIIVKVVGDDYGYEFRTYYIGDLVRPTTSGGMGGGMMGGMGGGMMGGMGGGMMGGMGGGMMGGMGGGMGGMMGGMGGGMMGGMGGGMGGGYGFDRNTDDSRDSRIKRREETNELINLGYQEVDDQSNFHNIAIGNNNGGGNNNSGNNSSGGYGNSGGGGGYGNSGGGGNRGGTSNYMQIMELNRLIMQSIAPNSWRYGSGGSRNQQGNYGAGRGGANGQDDNYQLDQRGYGMIIPFHNTYFNIYQTPEVHVEITEFLSTLRSMHGDQVSIESRLLTINNNILEDIGVDMDVLLNAAEHGWDKWSDIDIEQGHADWASPPAATGITGSLGGGAMPSAFQLSGSFLDNIQVDFLIRATKGNSRSRMLTAPHVTVFNGENAYVNFSREFVYVAEMDPEVGTGVVGYDVSTDTLNSGIEMNITPYISNDKRYVLMNIYFEQQILDSMFDFSYIGTDNNSTIDTVDGTDITPSSSDLTVRIQLPQTSVTEIDTKVAVPDGGTLLLGGQKLVGEAEQESGVPGLAHIPFLNRLFSTRNKTKDENIILVLIKPQIIIQSEMEEDNFGSLELEPGY